MDIVEFIKKRKIIIIVFLVMAAWITNLILSRPAKEPRPAFGPGATYKDLVPGKSLRSSVIEKMGSPISETAQGGRILLTFQSTSPNRSHETVLSDETLLFIKEVVTLADNKKIADITTQYGEAPNILYGPPSVGGFNLYVYPDRGLAYLGNPTGDGALIEVWYFPPTTGEDFQKNWATQYSETYSPNTQY